MFSEIALGKQSVSSFDVEAPVGIGDGVFLLTGNGCDHSVHRTDKERLSVSLGGKPPLVLRLS